MNRWFLLFPITLGATNSVFADSIWDRRDPRYAHLFQDNRARQIGDVVTVVINENTTANERESRAQDKSNNASGDVTYSGNTSGDPGGPTRAGALTFSLTDAFRRQFNGNAQFTSGRLFTDRLAVTVVDMMPNGNLVIEGYRSRVVAGEERVLRVTGVVRQQDIGVGNVVQSGSIANFRISYLGRGPTTRTTKQNYFGRVVNLLWPW